MIASDIFTVSLFVAIVLGLTPLLGSYLTTVFSSTPPMAKLFGPCERLVYRVCFINSQEEMNWKQYAKALTIFSVFSIVAVFLIQIFQAKLLLNPQSFAAPSWDLALNTAVSFVTNTNWQAYSGETTLSYATQMFALTVQNFTSAAVGIAVLLVLIRGLVRKNTHELGNFWVDITRATLYVLLPLSLLFALFLVSQGVVQNLSSYIKAFTVEGVEQLLAMGPAASQVAIKQLGTNGGGFFGANSAHPFENPTALSNLVQMVAILLVPSALVYMFGLLTQAKKHALMIYVVMLGIFILCLSVSLWSERLTGSLEGKELRFGVSNSVLWSVATTAASNGSVNAMHDSLSPLSVGVALLQIVLGEIVFGGVGSGLYGMILFVMLTLFLAGLMVGRTPEYLGKKIEAREIKLVLIGILTPSIIVLLGAGISCVYPPALAGLGNQGPRGLSEILYAFSSAANNNGSALAGLQVNTVYYNVTLSIAMLIGRFSVIFSVLAIAGALASKKKVPETAATFSTDTVIFAILLFGMILVVGALTFLPALSLGPIVEHLLMGSGKGF